MLIGWETEEQRYLHSWLSDSLDILEFTLGCLLVILRLILLCCTWDGMVLLLLWIGKKERKEMKRGFVF